jgi:hypothetical protein
MAAAEQQRSSPRAIRPTRMACMGVEQRILATGPPLPVIWPFSSATGDAVGGFYGRTNSAAASRWIGGFNFRKSVCYKFAAYIG